MKCPTSSHSYFGKGIDSTTHFVPLLLLFFFSPRFTERIQRDLNKNYTGYYPESLHVDKIYRTRENRAWCKERGIRISGVPLGRPPASISKEKKTQAKFDERIRNCIEGKFGQGKRRFTMNQVMTKLSYKLLRSLIV